MNDKILKTAVKIIRKPNKNIMGLVDAEVLFCSELQFNIGPVGSNPKINIVIGTVKKNAEISEIKKNNAVERLFFNGSCDSNFN